MAIESILIQQLILGIIQGITEWLPISSSAMTTLVMTNFFQVTDITLLLHQALFLHLGTFFAALIYLRNDVSHLIKSLFNYKKSNEAPYFISWHGPQNQENKSAIVFIGRNRRSFRSGKAQNS